MTMFIIIILIIILIVVLICQSMIASEKQQKAVDHITKKIKSINHFEATQSYMQLGNGSSIIIDENNKKLCLIKNDQSNTMTVVSYSDILSSEIIEDGESITKTSRASQVGGALLGGIILGVAGAVIGGLSGKKTTSGKAKSIALRVVVNNTDNPDHYISFLDIETKKDNTLYKTAIDTARKWQSIINILIRQADKEDNEKLEALPSAHSSPKHLSVAQELEQLAELKNKGILTDEEFNTEKKKILSR
ncbi:MAG: SHOCT domain-containing protein [Wohlfahrtiimonas sp.]